MLERFKKVLKEKANGALAFGEVSLHGYTMVRIASKKRVDAYCMPPGSTRYVQSEAFRSVTGRESLERHLFPERYRDYVRSAKYSVTGQRVVLRSFRCNWFTTSYITNRGQSSCPPRAGCILMQSDSVSIR